MDSIKSQIDFVSGQVITGGFQPETGHAAQVVSSPKEHEPTALLQKNSPSRTSLRCDEVMTPHCQFTTRCLFATV